MQLFPWANLASFVLPQLKLRCCFLGTGCSSPQAKHWQALGLVLHLQSSSSRLEKNVNITVVFFFAWGAGISCAKWYNGGNISPSWEACKGSVGKLAGEITIIIRTSVACRIVASLYFPPIARKHILLATRLFHQSMTISICQSYYVTYYVRNGRCVEYSYLVGCDSDC